MVIGFEILPANIHPTNIKLSFLVGGQFMGTDFLFSNPSALAGTARTLDLFGAFDSYNESRTPQEADARAILSDVRTTVEDLKGATSEETTGGASPQK